MDRQRAAAPSRAQRKRKRGRRRRRFPAFATFSHRTKNATTRSERTYRCRRTRRFGVMGAEQGACVRRRSWEGYTINMFEFEFPTGTAGAMAGLACGRRPYGSPKERPAFTGQSLSPHGKWRMLRASVLVVEPQNREHVARPKKRRGLAAPGSQTSHGRTSQRDRFAGVLRRF
jgi:hypothetical protein